jgi:hypothetical protein
MHFNATAFAFPFVCENAEEAGTCFRQARHESPINGYPTTIPTRLNLVFDTLMPNRGDRTVSAMAKKNGRSRKAPSLGHQHLGGHVAPSVPELVIIHTGAGAVIRRRRGNPIPV